MDGPDPAVFSLAAADGGKTHFQTRGFAAGTGCGQQDAIHAGAVFAAGKRARLAQFIFPGAGGRQEFLAQRSAECFQALPGGSGCADADPAHILTKTVRRLFRVSFLQVGPEKTANGINGPRGGCIHNNYCPVADVFSDSKDEFTAPSRRKAPRRPSGHGWKRFGGGDKVCVANAASVRVCCGSCA